MSEYRRFFSYIYAYEQNQKTSNTGFAKIEMRGQVTTIELHMRGAFLSAPAACLYLFVRTGDSIQGFALGDVPFSGGNADWRFTLNQPQLGDSSYQISDAAGILFLLDEEICFVSQWDEAPINWESFHIFEREETPTQDEQSKEIPTQGEQSEKTPVQDAPPRNTPAQDTPSQDTPSPDTPTPEQTTDARKENVIQTAELAMPQPKTWQQLLNTRPPVQPFADPDISCVKIELKDLRLLPSANWHLCNNSFLLHAFFTYRHLIFGCLPSAKGYKCFIGVPGIRYRQEHVMAALFGFSDFLPDKESADAEAPFGYWYISMIESD